MNSFAVHYQLKVATTNNGEFTNETIMRSETMENSSDYLPEILIDIVEKHRHEWLMGIEIQKIEPALV